MLFFMIKIKRAYEEAEKSDGFRILIDRMWPRGIKKENAEIDLWLKDIAPSPDLRKWFAHDVKKWEEFKKKYIEELKQKQDLIKIIKEKAVKTNVSLIYSAKDKEHNNAVVIMNLLKI